MNTGLWIWRTDESLCTNLVQRKSVVEMSGFMTFRKPEYQWGSQMGNAESILPGSARTQDWKHRFIYYIKRFVFLWKWMTAEKSFREFKNEFSEGQFPDIHSIEKPLPLKVIHKIANHDKKSYIKMYF